MKRLISAYSFLIAVLIFTFLCTKTTPKIKSQHQNVDSVFILKDLPHIRDAYCSNTLTIQHLMHIFKGSSFDYTNGVELTLDSSDTIGKYYHIIASVNLGKNDDITSLKITFPPFHYHNSLFVKNDQMIHVFGNYEENTTPIKDGSRGVYVFGKNCDPPKRFAGHLNVDNSVRYIFMSED